MKRSHLVAVLLSALLLLCASPALAQLDGTHTAIATGNLQTPDRG